MDTSLLIHAIVRQTTVLIAELATRDGARTPVAGVASQVFANLSEELERQGVSRKVAADMFGLALRSYQKRVQRLTESRGEQGRSLWEVVFETIGTRGPIDRPALLHRFRYEEDASLRGIIRDLVESGLVFENRSGTEPEYTVAAPEEIVRADSEGIATLVWHAVFTRGPAVADALGIALPPEQLAGILAGLVADGRVVREETAGIVTWRADAFVIPAGVPAGWETAMFDHFQALVTTLVRRLRGEEGAGSTYAIDIDIDHPLYDEVQSYLERSRRELSDLRTRVDAVTAEEGRTPTERVTLYLGQTRRPGSEHEGSEHEGSEHEGSEREDKQGGESNE